MKLKNKKKINHQLKNKTKLNSFKNKREDIN
jgi:hypothetical protein